MLAVQVWIGTRCRGSLHPAGETETGYRKHRVLLFEDDCVRIGVKIGDKVFASSSPAGYGGKVLTNDIWELMWVSENVIRFKNDYNVEFTVTTPTDQATIDLITEALSRKG